MPPQPCAWQTVINTTAADRFNTDTFTTTASDQAVSNAVADLGQQVIDLEITDEIDIEHVLLNIDVQHTRWSDLTLTLVSPTGTRSILLDRNGVQNGQTFLSNPVGQTELIQSLVSTHFLGEHSIGTWQLIVQDQAAGGEGRGNITASLNITGRNTFTNPAAIEHYTLTDEYAGGWNLQPATTHPTELNAAAVTGNLSIDLSGTTASNINGKSIVIGTGIDRLVGGAGNDTLTGSTAGDNLVGGDGNDVINGSLGDDTLEGGITNDEQWQIAA